MIDTLQLAQDLEAAGMDRKQAEQVSRSLDKAARERLASRTDLEKFTEVMAAKLDSQFHKLTAMVAVALLAHLAVVWGIIASNIPG
jgi:hypothetical protein